MKLWSDANTQIQLLQYTAHTQRDYGISVTHPRRLLTTVTLPHNCHAGCGLLDAASSDSVIRRGPCRGGESKNETGKEHRARRGGFQRPLLARSWTAAPLQPCQRQRVRAPRVKSECVVHGSVEITQHRGYTVLCINICTSICAWNSLNWFLFRACKMFAFKWSPSLSSKKTPTVEAIKDTQTPFLPSVNHVSIYIRIHTSVHFYCIIYMLL